MQSAVFYGLTGIQDHIDGNGAGAPANRAFASLVKTVLMPKRGRVARITNASAPAPDR